MLQYLFIYAYSNFNLSIKAVIFYPARKIVNILIIGNRKKYLTLVTNDLLSNKLYGKYR